MKPRDPFGVRSVLGGVAGFAAELKRRHVLRVALVYCAVGWLIAQVSNTFFPALDMPSWTVSLVVMLVILGFPVAVLLAWAYDLTPQGIQRSPARAEPAAPADAAAAIIAPPPDGAAVAALPFVDRSATADHQFLGDGITEELINGLARVDGLRVVARTSSFALRHDAADVREIGRRLGVGHVVEGSVRVAGDRLRLAVQLVSVADGYAVWSSTFDRRVADVFSVQEDVARAVVQALEPQLLGTASPADGSAPRPLLLPRSTTDFEAYALYLRGRQQWNERTPRALRRAVAYFEQAIARDPTYAHAHAGLADCWAILVDHGIVLPADGLPQAAAAARAALERDDDIAEAHTAAALVAQLEWRFDDAERGFLAALARNPGYAPARQRRGLLLAWLGRFDEARAELLQAQHLDPLSPVVAASRGWIEYYARDFDEAVRIERATLAEQPDALPALVPLALALLQLGRADDAVRELRRARELADENILTFAFLVVALARAGHSAEAEELLAPLQERARRTGDAPYALAVALLGLKRDDEALAALERAADQHAPQLVHLRVDPHFDPLRGTPRFERILAQLRDHAVR
jgi:TolB-like protein